MMLKKKLFVFKFVVNLINMVVVPLYPNRNSKIANRNYIPSVSILILSCVFFAAGTTLADSWATKTSMPTARGFLSCQTVNGSIYAIGGGYNTLFATVEKYDPSTDTWTTKTSMSAARNSPTCSVVNGKIYAIGGHDGSSYVNKVEEYDPSTDTWTTKTSMPSGRGNLSSSVVNGKIYVIGGILTSGAISNVVEEYDPATDTWSTKTSMSTTRYTFTCSAVNDKIYAIGGYNGSRLATVEEYDPVTDTWTTKASMSAGRSDTTSSSINGKIYVIGGRVGNNVTVATVEEYDPATDTWITKTSMLNARDYLTSSVVNGKIYAIGGFDSGFTEVSTVEEYTPDNSCLYSISPTSNPFDSSGYAGSVSVSASDGCSWTATTGESWIDIYFGSTGSGNGTVSYLVDANTGTDPRTGTMTIAGETFTVTQSGATSCDYTLSPTSETLDSSGGSSDIYISTSSDCEWTATSEASWISITTNDSGVGSGTLSYFVFTNTSNSSRTGTIDIEDLTYTITQLGLECEYALSSTSNEFDSSGGTGNVGVTASSECDWTANSNASWIVLTSNASGVGNGVISYSVSTNTTDISRTGTITVADQTHTVIQEEQTTGECTYAISSTGKEFESSEGTGSVTVITQDGCEWFATSNNSWIEILTGKSGTGTEEINYSVSENTSANDRTGTITILGSTMTLTFTVSQGFTTCEYTLSATNKAFGFEEGIGNISMITSSDDCIWTATSNDSWITIISGSIGDGDGTISFSVAENTGGDRTGSIDIIGATTSVTFTVTQEERPECDISISSAGKDFGCDGGTGFIDVDPEQSDCDWTASSTDSWITIISGSSGTGSGTVIYSVLSVETPVSREGQIVVAGKTFTVLQICDADCEFTLSSNDKEFDLQGGTDSVFVTTGSDCFWTAASSNSWITILSGSSRTGIDSVTYSVSEMTSEDGRTGTMTIAGETFTVTQNLEIISDCATYDPVTGEVYIPSLDAGLFGKFEVILDPPHNIRSAVSVIGGCEEASYDISTEEVHMPTIDAGALGTYDVILEPPYNIVSLMPK